MSSYTPGYAAAVHTRNAGFGARDKLFNIAQASAAQLLTQPPPNTNTY